MTQVLRPDQLAVVGDLRAAMRDYKRVIAQIPTGGGKTTIAAVCARDAVAKGGAVWFVCHRRELVYQAQNRFHNQGLDVGIMLSGHGYRSAAATVMSIQTLLARDAASLPTPKLVFFDECHHIAAATWLKVMEQTRGAYCIGLSATPYRADGAGLGVGFDCVVNGPTPREMVEAGILVEPEIWATPTNENVDVNGDVVQAYADRFAGGRAIVFARSVEHSKALVEQFKSAGVVAEHLEGETPTRERAKILRRFERGHTAVVSNVHVLTEGFDLPSLAGVILASSTKSEALFVQKIGRALRSSPGKDKGIIIDAAGNVERHGHPLAYRPADLSGRKLKKAEEGEDDEERMRLCQRCLMLARAGPPVCPGCGARYAEALLPVTNVKAQFERVLPAEPKPLPARRSSWVTHLERSTRKTNGVVMRSQLWDACYKYRVEHGKMPFEDRDVWTTDEARRYRGILFRREGAGAR